MFIFDKKRKTESVIMIPAHRDVVSEVEPSGVEVSEAKPRSRAEGSESGSFRAGALGPSHSLSFLLFVGQKVGKKPSGCKASPIAPSAHSAKWLKLNPCGARVLNSKPFTTAMLRPHATFCGARFRIGLNARSHDGIAVIWLSCPQASLLKRALENPKKNTLFFHR